MQPKVSICIPTYNHENYIAAAIEGVLAQKTDFHFEILIGEDDSEDATRKICKEYAARHPGKIRLFLNSRENVIFIDGKPTGRWNIINLLNECRGQFIALCDGDDFWVSPTKLQHQVEFLETHPDYSFCLHDSLVVDESGNTISEKFCHKRSTGEFPLSEFFKENRTATCSKVFNAAVIIPPPETDHILAYDWLLSIYAGSKGRIQYFDDVWSAYRIHSAGLWQQMNEVEMKEAGYNALSGIDEFFDYKYRRLILPSLVKRKLELARSFWASREYLKSLSCLLESLRLKFLAGF